MADTKQHQLQVLTSSGERRQGVGFVKNTPAGTDDRSFNWPYDIAIRPSDRFAFVVDTQNHRIKAYDVANATWPTDNKGPHAGARVRHAGHCQRRTSSSRAASPSGPTGTCSSPTGATTGSRSSPSRRRTASRYVRTWNAGGSLNEPEGVAVDATGRVVVADSADDEMVVMAPDGSVEATVGGLHHPSAVEVGQDGTIYLADTYADVVRTYTMGSTPPPDTTAPTATYAAPGNGSTVPVGPVTIGGTASDNQSVAAAFVALRRNDDNTWLRTNGTWGAFQWLPTDARRPGCADDVVERRGHAPGRGRVLRHAAGRRRRREPERHSATDPAVHGRRGRRGHRRADRHRHLPGQPRRRDLPVTITGSAADDRGVASVRLGIKQAATGLWWNGTSWQAAATKVQATLGHAERRVDHLVLPAREPALR